MIKRLQRIGVIIILLSVVLTACSVIQPEEEATFTPDVTPTARLSVITDLIQEVECADERSDLYLIDDEVAVWYREGSCADNAYGINLYDAATGALLCQHFDSIAGPQTRCDSENYQDLFDQLINTDDPTSLDDYSVEEVPTG